MGLAFVIPIAPALAIPNTFKTCDIFTGVGGGQIDWFRPNNCPGIPSSVTLQGVLQATGFSDTYMTGMSFDTNGGCQTTGQPCLYATTFSANTIAVFDNTGAYLGSCGPVGGANPAGNGDIESAIVVPGFAGAGGPSIFFGQADGDRNILQYPLPCNSSSTLTARFAPCTSGACAGTERGTDWVDMTSNLCDVQYTSENTGVLDFNVCTNTQGTALTTTIAPFSYAHKVLADGSVIVADTAQATHVNSAGVTINTCDQAGVTGQLFSMDILPDQKAFAIANLGGDNTVDYITVAHCDAGQTTPDFSFVGLPPTQTGTSGLIGGVAIFGEFSPQPTLTTLLSSSTIAPGGSASDTATLTNLNSPTGTITFFVSTTNSCPTETATQVGSAVTVTGNGPYNSISKTFATAGTYYWYAHYSGDSNNKALTSACEPLVVTGGHTVPEFGASAILVAALAMLGVAIMSRKFRISAPTIQA